MSPIRPLCGETGAPMNRLSLDMPELCSVYHRYKQQLSLAAERERVLEESNKMRAELDWQQLCENAESNWYGKSENRARSPSSAGEQGEADRQRSDCRLHELKTLLSALPVERELATQASFNRCILPEGEKQGPNPKVLEENMANLNQQLPDADPGVGLQCGVRCTLQGMQNTLKEAARKISILSQEKQQLIEMGNRLRAELAMVLKEGLGHPASSGHGTVCAAAGSLLPRELVKRTQCQLSALKHLQHRLTTQVQLDFSIENHWPEQQRADTSSKIIPSQPLRQSPSPAQQAQRSSPGAQNFCQGTWQTLETGSSLPVFSPQKNTAQVNTHQMEDVKRFSTPGIYINSQKQFRILTMILRAPIAKVAAEMEFEVVRSAEQSEESQQNIKAKDKLEVTGSALTVRGTRLAVQQKLKSRNLSCPRPIKPKIPSNITKIRNYNIKD
ncbi:hypothetical protein Q9233_007284 [Columba guinea]|nr:hypothetical protein Q9233_007284 [Columba guinea]